MFPFEFRGEVRRGKTRVMRLLCGVSFMILASTVFVQSTRVTDVRPDVRPELRSHIYAIAYICCRAQKLYNINRQLLSGLLKSAQLQSYSVIVNNTAGRSFVHQAITTS